MPYGVTNELLEAPVHPEGPSVPVRDGGGGGGAVPAAASTTAASTTAASSAATTSGNTSPCGASSTALMHHSGQESTTMPQFGQGNFSHGGHYDLSQDVVLRLEFASDMETRVGGALAARVALWHLAAAAGTLVAHGMWRCQGSRGRCRPGGIFALAAPKVR